METLTEKTIPVYKGKNIFGYGMDFMANTPEFCHKMEPELGDTFEVRVPGRKLLVTFRPEIIRHVLQANARNYKKAKIYEYMKAFLGNGLVTSEGDFWKKQRRIAQPAFHKKHLEDLFETMVDETEDYLEDLLQRCGTGKTFDIAEEMMYVTANIVMKALFTTPNTADIEQMYDTMEYVQDVTVKKLYQPYMTPLNYINGTERKYRRRIAEVHNMMQRMIEERKASTDRPSDLLTLLLEAVDEETGEGMTDEQLRDEIVTLYIAGHETSANALNWTLYLLTQNPDVLGCLRAEEQEVLNGRRPTFADLMHMPYARQVIEESMRLYPPAYVVSRVPVEDDEVDGVRLPAGGIVYISIYALQRSPQFWEDPDKFNPDRFNRDKVKERQRGVYMPFGAGARMCIGNNFALMEMQMLITLLTRTFDFELIQEQKIETHPLITLKPKYGIQMRVTPRG